ISVSYGSDTRMKLLVIRTIWSGAFTLQSLWDLSSSILDTLSSVTIGLPRFANDLVSSSEQSSEKSRDFAGKRIEWRISPLARIWLHPTISPKRGEGLTTFLIIPVPCQSSKY